MRFKVYYEINLRDACPFVNCMVFSSGLEPLGVFKVEGEISNANLRFQISNSVIPNLTLVGQVSSSTFLANVDPLSLRQCPL
jgi:hypothetical protein